MVNKRALSIAVIVSLAIHIVLIFGLSWLNLLHMPQRQKEKKQFNVKIAPPKQYGIGQSAIPSDSIGVPSRAEILQFERPKFDEKIQSFAKEEVDFNKKEELAAMTDNNKPQSITKAVEGYVNTPTESPKDHGFLKQREQRPTKETLVDVGQLAGQDALEKPGDVTGEMVSAEFVDKMPGITPALIENPTSNEDAGKKQTSKLANRAGNYQPVISGPNNLGDFGKHLLWAIETYEDPTDHGKYFRLSLHTNPDAPREDLPTISKEIILLVDCSISIEAERLDQFKNGIRYILNRLNPEDRFNIVAFKNTIIPFKSQSVAKDDKAIDAAIRFVEQLTAGEKTDTYQALNQTVTSAKTLKPAYLLLLSDGRPTQGITNSMRLINSISDVNKGEISIFAFSGGLAVNRYLLDFIAYKNRGWAEHSYRSNLISKNLGNLYDKLRDPIVLNLRYQANGVPEEDLFPKILPDFFRNTELVVYGKYEKAQPFVFRLLGDIEGNTHEFLIQADLSQAAKGGEDVAKAWAFNRIYDLISQMKYNQDNQAILNEIQTLSQKFKMEVPYLDYLQK